MTKTLFAFLIVSALFSFETYNENKLKVEYDALITQDPQMVIKRVGTLYTTKENSFYKEDTKILEKKEAADEPDKIYVDSKETKKASEIFVNFKEKKLTEKLYENLFLKKSFSVSETRPVMKWVFGNGQKNISNYNCSMAYTTFRGRTYIVWFTKKIPVSSGPWKLNGLPGLILLAEDQEGVYKWQAKSITFPYTGNDTPSKNTLKEDPKFKSITYKDFDKLRIDAIKEKIDLVKARNKNRVGMRGQFEYSTHLEKEPINEWRTQVFFD